MQGSWAFPSVTNNFNFTLSVEFAQGINVTLSLLIFPPGADLSSTWTKALFGKTRLTNHSCRRFKFDATLSPFISPFSKFLDEEAPQQIHLMTAILS